jgi:hypothetical protein
VISTERSFRSGKMAEGIMIVVSQKEVPLYGTQFDYTELSY